MSPSAVIQQLRALSTPLDKYLFLRNLQRDQEAQFYQLLLKHTEEILPYVYTPTVGEACQRYSHLPISTHGLYLRATDAGSFLDKLRDWPKQCIRVIVVTDGERILGLGDLGAGGMGISEGKILLYTAAAGVHPQLCLPVCLDVGTNNRELLQDQAYKGLRQKRLTGQAYDAILDEFVQAVRQWQPHVLVQFEDFANHNAFRLLQRYRGQLCCFNDDIQGTACITLAGLLSAVRATGTNLVQQRFLFYGAGEAGTGIGELIALALERRHGLSREQGRQHCFFMDSKGLVCTARRDLQEHKRPFAHDIPFQRDLLAAVRQLWPTALIGVSTSRGAFSAEVIQEMAAINQRPIIFPLSNPTSMAECTFEEAFHGTAGRVLFASGSPFQPITTPQGTQFATQSNNAYVFPAIGHAAVLTCCSHIPDDVFLLAAEALAHMTTLDELDQGLLFPRFTHIFDVSAQLCGVVAQHMVCEGLGSLPKDFAALLAGRQYATRTAWEEYVRAKMLSGPTAKL